jgi:arylsulfatase A-like enzyme
MKRFYVVLLLKLIFLFPLASDAGQRPNILFIVADDQSPFDLRMYDPSSTLETPALDKLADEGMVITRAYHMGAWVGGVCYPSRQMIMSGRSVWHLPESRRNPVSPARAPADLAEHTMAAVFNRAGYRTMRTCKTGNSYQEANAKFRVLKEKRCLAGNDEEGSAWHARQVLEFLEQRRVQKDTVPFLIYYGFTHPHDPRYGKPELLKKYGAVNHTDPDALPQVDPSNPPPALQANYLPAHPFRHGHPTLRDEERVEGVWKRRDESTIRNELGRYYACSENIDIQIARVLDKLEEMGELENTYIFYTADHGIAIGRHGLQGKQNLYEHTWRVPLIVKGPAVRKGTAPGNVYLMDVLGTLCDIAGIAVPETFEGKSFLPVLEGKQEIVRDVLYGVYSGGTKPGMRCIRSGDWKLIKYDVMEGEVRKTQLFNLRDNPYELLEEHHVEVVAALTGNIPEKHQKSLADDPRYQDKRKELEILLIKEMERLDDPHKLWDQ